MPLSWVLVSDLVVLGALATRGLYRPPLQVDLIETTRVVLVATGLAAAVAIATRVVVANSVTTADEGLRFWVVATVLLALGRIVLGRSELRARRAGEAGYRTLIIGAGATGRRIAKRLRQNRLFGLTPVGFLDKEPLSLGPTDNDPPVLGSSWDIDRIVEEHGIEHVVFTFSTAPTDVLLRLLKRCHELGLGTSVVPRLYERLTTDTSVESLGGVPLVVNHVRHPRGWQFCFKYAVDRVAASLMLVLLAPALAALALAVWLSLGRPILYRQERVGRDGVHFDMLKFRSMRPPSGGESEQAAVDVSADIAPGGVEGTDRRTRVGALMRHLSLDELPQLLNIVRGEMSFIGPRPERPQFVDLFDRNVHRYGERHRVKSGITGWAQVNGLRGNTSIADRAEWDNHYIENWSLWFDLKILLLTVAVVLRPAEVE
jgi:exopolysaccharide biosynthesis polyprenyl glycosylphosphotransferase